MVNVLSFGIFRVRSLHTTINITVLVLLKKEHLTNKSNEHTMFMINVSTLLNIDYEGVSGCMLLSTSPEAE